VLPREGERLLLEVQGQRPGPAAPAARPDEPRRTPLEQELDQLHRRYARGVGMFLRRNGIPPADAEELVNDVFIGVYRAMQTKREFHAGPRAYVFGVASNKMRRYWREHHARQPHVDHVQQLEEADARLDQPDDTSQIDDSDELAAFQPVLKALAARQREAYVLRHYFGFMPAEIAEVMGISVKTVKTHLERARREVAEQLRRKEEAS
jgi:RNA polymerase sigma factor (sigma-70 family)